MASTPLPRCHALLALVLACTPEGRSEPTRAPDASAEGQGEARLPAGARTSSTAAPSAEAPPRVRVVDHDRAWLEERLAAQPVLRRTLRAPEKHRMQLLITWRSKGGSGVRLDRARYRADAEYFYPASAIKTFASVAALLELERLREQSGQPLGLDTPWAMCPPGDGGPCQPGDPRDPRDRTLTLGGEIRKTQQRSDNQAMGRLYDFVGHEALNGRWHALGWASLRFHHRMGESAVAGRASPRVELLVAGGERVAVPARDSSLELPPTPAPGTDLGRAHLHPTTGLRHDGPMSFHQKNYVSLEDLHRLTLSLVDPSLPGATDLGLRDEHRTFLLETMASPVVDPASPLRDPTLDRPMLAGIRAQLGRPPARYVNKSGRAYGFHVENAYVELDDEHAVFVTAVVHANPDEIINDDDYDYEGHTQPFLEQLGGVVAAGSPRLPQ